MYILSYRLMIISNISIEFEYPKLSQVTIEYYIHNIKCMNTHENGIHGIKY